MVEALRRWVIEDEQQRALSRVRGRRQEEKGEEEEKKGEERDRGRHAEEEEEDEGLEDEEEEEDEAESRLNKIGLCVVHSISVMQMIAALVVVCLEWQRDCACNLRLWLLVLIARIMLRSWVQLRVQRVEAEWRAERRRRRLAGEAEDLPEEWTVWHKVREAVDIFGLIWWTIGNAWVFGGSGCVRSCPASYYTALSVILATYLVMLGPLILVVLALPFLIMLSPWIFTQHRRRRAALERLGREHEDDTHGGIDPSKIPVIVFNKHTAETQLHGDPLCAICLCEYEEGQRIRTLLCDGQHHFHCECIDEWFQNKSRCPCCRGNPFGQPAKAKKKRRARTGGDSTPDNATTLGESGTVGAADAVGVTNDSNPAPQHAAGAANRRLWRPWRSAQTSPREPQSAAETVSVSGDVAAMFQPTAASVTPDARPPAAIWAPDPSSSSHSGTSGVATTTATMSGVELLAQPQSRAGATLLSPIDVGDNARGDDAEAKSDEEADERPSRRGGVNIVAAAGGSHTHNSHLHTGSRPGSATTDTSAAASAAAGFEGWGLNLATQLVTEFTRPGPRIDGNQRSASVSPASRTNEQQQSDLEMGASGVGANAPAIVARSSTHNDESKETAL